MGTFGLGGLMGNIVIRFIDPNDEESPYHYWGDDKHDWNAIWDAVAFVGMSMKKYRIPVSQVKEKFGVLRAYCSLGYSDVLSIFCPGYYVNKWLPKWAWELNVYHSSKIMWLINFFAVPYHKWAYRRIYKQAVEKFPTVKRQILCDADFPELLKGL